MNAFDYAFYKLTNLTSSLTSPRYLKIACYCMSISVIALGLLSGSMALAATTDDLMGDFQFTMGVCRILAIHEGNFGALAMIIAGIVALVSAAMGNYKACISVLVVGCGTWIVRPILQIFFDVTSFCDSPTAKKVVGIIP